MSSNAQEGLESPSVRRYKGTTWRTDIKKYLSQVQMTVSERAAMPPSLSQMTHVYGGSHVLAEDAGRTSDK